MEQVPILDREIAQTYAEWFRTLADATRVQLLAWLAQQPEPVPVRSIVEAFPLSQSTVSHHLAALSAVRFLTAQRRGTSTYYAVNPACLEEFPDAADLLIRGRICCPTPPHDSAAEPRRPDASPRTDR